MGKPVAVRVIGNDAGVEDMLSLPLVWNAVLCRRSGRQSGQAFLPDVDVGFSSWIVELVRESLGRKG